MSAPQKTLNRRNPTHIHTHISWHVSFLLPVLLLAFYPYLWTSPSVRRGQRYGLRWARGRGTGSGRPQHLGQVSHHAEAGDVRARARAVISEDGCGRPVALEHGSYGRLNPGGGGLPAHLGGENGAGTHLRILFFATARDGYGRRGGLRGEKGMGGGGGGIEGANEGEKGGSNAYPTPRTDRQARKKIRGATFATSRGVDAVEPTPAPRHLRTTAHDSDKVPTTI